MPELPDITVYVESIARKVVGAVFEKVRLASPFLLRSVDPPLSAATGKRVLGVHRIGKRVAIDLEDDLHLVIHLMVAGRFKWAAPSAKGPAKVPGKVGLAAFDFSTGTLLLTEASTRKRASLHVVRGDEGLRAIDPGGLEPLDATSEQFAEALRRERHTLKRTLTDPHLFSGIGNAYSDEILHRAQLSPVRMSTALTDEEVARLHTATRAVLIEFTERLRAEALAAKGEFPEKVTAFRDDMAVHGKHGQPCPRCGAKVQRIVHAENESNYCAPCQTGGKLLADRALSRLLHGDWPKTLEDMEEYRAQRREPKA